MTNRPLSRTASASYSPYDSNDKTVSETKSTKKDISGIFSKAVAFAKQSRAAQAAANLFRDFRSGVKAEYKSFNVSRLQRKAENNDYAVISKSKLNDIIESLNATANASVAKYKASLLDAFGMTSEVSDDELKSKFRDMYDIDEAEKQNAEKQKSVINDTAKAETVAADKTADQTAYAKKVTKKRASKTKTAEQAVCEASSAQTAEHVIDKTANACKAISKEGMSKEFSAVFDMMKQQMAIPVESRDYTGIANLMQAYVNDAKAYDASLDSKSVDAAKSELKATIVDKIQATAGKSSKTGAKKSKAYIGNKAISKVQTPVKQTVAREMPEIAENTAEAHPEYCGLPFQ